MDVHFPGATVTPEVLERCGTLLFGRRWKTELAQAISVSVATVKLWSKGAAVMGENHRRRIYRLMEDRAEKLSKEADKLEAVSQRIYQTAAKFDHDYQPVEPAARRARKTTKQTRR